MPEANSYSFTNDELLRLLIQKAGIKTGKWTLEIRFGFTAGNFGPDEKSLSPGAAVIISQIGITHAAPNTPPSMVVDAADLAKGSH